MKDNVDVELDVAEDSDAPVGLGEDGELGCTSFWNLTVPLLRFRSGDNINYVAEVDDTGKGGRLMQFSSKGSRVDDSLTLHVVKFFGCDAVVETLTQEFGTQLQLISLPCQDNDHQGDLLQVRTEKELNDSEKDSLKQRLVESLAELIPSDEAREILDNTEIEFAVGLEIGSTGKVTKVINKRV